MCGVCELDVVVPQVVQELCCFGGTFSQEVVILMVLLILQIISAKRCEWNTVLLTSSSVMCFGRFTSMTAKPFLMASEMYDFTESVLEQSALLCRIHSSRIPYQPSVVQLDLSSTRIRRSQDLRRVMQDDEQWPLIHVIRSAFIVSLHVE